MPHSKSAPRTDQALLETRLPVFPSLDELLRLVCAIELELARPLRGPLFLSYSLS